MVEQIITVASMEKDSYGNLLVTDNMGKQWKVNQKRENLFPHFMTGRATVVDIKQYSGHDYIADAKPFEGKPPGDKQVAPVTAGVAKSETQQAPSTAAGETGATIPMPKVVDKGRSYALAYAKDLCVAGKIEVDQVKTLANKFVKWLEGGE